jgi:hypothetical protein
VILVALTALVLPQVAAAQRPEQVRRLALLELAQRWQRVAMGEEQGERARHRNALQPRRDGAL